MGDRIDDESGSTSPSSELISEIAINTQQQQQTQQTQQQQQPEPVSYSPNHSVNQSHSHKNPKKVIITPKQSNNNNIYGSTGTGGANIGQSPHISNHSPLNNVYNSPSSRHGDNNYDYNALNNNINNNDITTKVPIMILIFFISIVLLCIIAILGTFYFTIIDKNDKNSVTDIRSIIIPLIIYICNIASCSIFWINSRKLQTKGYSTLFENASQISKLNFRFTSVYFTICFALYGFLLNNKTNIITDNTRKYIFLALYVFIYVFIGCCLFRYWYIFYEHNKYNKKPDIFSTHGIENSAAIANSPSNTHNNNINNINNNNQKDVIKQLFNDKKTLKRQLFNVSQKLTKTQNQLRLLTNNKNNNLINNNNNNNNNLNDNNSNINQIKAKNHKLMEDIQTEMGKVKSLNIQIKTIKTMLDAKSNECKQQKNMIATYESRINTLTQEKEKLENEINAGYDQKEHILVLYQVKEEEVKTAQMENKRLREKLNLYANSDKEKLLNDIQKLKKIIEKMQNH